MRLLARISRSAAAIVEASAAGRRVGRERAAARDGWPGAGNGDAAGGRICPPNVGDGTDPKYAAIVAS